MAPRVRRQLRGPDLIARFADDAIAVMLAEADYRAAQGMANRISTGIQEGLWEVLPENALRAEATVVLNWDNPDPIDRSWDCQRDGDSSSGRNDDQSIQAFHG